MNRKEWKMHFAEQKDSGLSIQQYCDQHQLKYKNFTGAKSRYATSIEAPSFISVVPPTTSAQQPVASIQIACGKVSATIEQCTPQWIAHFITILRTV